MITGPTMVGKDDLAFRLLATGHEKGEGALLLTTSDSTSRLLDELEGKIPTIDRELVSIVDGSGSVDRQTVAEFGIERISSA